MPSSRDRNSRSIPGQRQRLRLTRGSPLGPAGAVLGAYRGRASPGHSDVEHIG
ncbi:hypothetical protein SEA_YAGO84_57 [Gordonia phage Yago84]|nr:hypothetical protein SEA_YAGO84_57 [Gordonia phage Yago84]